MYGGATTTGCVFHNHEGFHRKPTSRKRRLGAAIAKACAEEGAIPVIVDRDEAAGEQLRSELAAKRTAAGLLAFELTDSQNCRNAVRQAAAWFVI